MHQQSHGALSVEAVDQAGKLIDRGHWGPIHGQDYVTLADSCPFGQARDSGDENPLAETKAGALGLGKLRRPQTQPADTGFLG